MLTLEEYYALQAGASNGLALLWLTVAVALVIFGLIVRTASINVTMPMPSMPLPRLRVQPLALILLIGLVVRLVRIGEPLWYDEAFTAGIAVLPLGNLPAAIAGDVHPPLWYLVEWLFVHLFGSSEIVLRLPALLFGIGTVLMLYRLALALQLGEAVALIAALIVALLPAPVYYSAEARAYSLLSYMALYALVALVAGKPRPFVVCVALLPITHNLGYVYAMVFGLLALWRYRREWLRPLALTTLPGLIWLPSLLAQSRDVADGFWLGNLTLAGVLDPLLTMTVGRKIAEWSVLPVYVIVIVMILMSLWWCRRWVHWDDGKLLFGFMFGVPALVALTSFGWRNVYLDRGLLPCVMVLVILWANTLVYHPRRKLLTALTGMALGVGMVGYISADANTRQPVQPVLALGCAGADAIYTTGIPAALFSSYYLPQSVTLWPAANDMNQTLPLSAKQAFGWNLSSFDRMTGTVCIVAFTTPLTSQAETEHLNSLFDRFPIVARQHTEINQTWHIDTYRLEMN